MTSWEPHVDLARLLDALGEEIVATTEQEVRQACDEDCRSIRAAANELRRLIGGAIGDPDSGLAVAEATRRHEFLHRQH
jgi:hypothetical protein